jgi:hypothetical protein
MLLKEDVNFLEHPLWVVSQRSSLNSLKITQKNGEYELKCVEGLPVRFDKLVLYYLLHLFFNFPSEQSNRVAVTRYAIAKNILQTTVFGKPEYDRIMLALRRWKAIFIKFEGIFLEGDRRTIRYFSVIDSVIFDKKTGGLAIDFNEQYIKQLAQTNCYTLINFNEYRKLDRPIAARLYEILLISFQMSDLWAIAIFELAEKLTIEKRKYASQILTALNPAIDEILAKTGLSFSFVYDKSDAICLFRKKQ